MNICLLDSHALHTCLSHDNLFLAPITPPATQASIKERLARIQQNYENAEEAEYLEGLKRKEDHMALYAELTSPLFEPEVEDMPSPRQDEDSGEVIELLEPRADLSDIHAEGNGREILLQVFTSSSSKSSSQSL